MSALTDFDLDETGKIDLTDIYVRPDPRDYCQTLVNLDYRIPAEAEPLFRQVIDARRLACIGRRLGILDVGCSYGVNAALLKHRCSLAEFFRRYAAAATGAMSRGELIARDRSFFDQRPHADDLTFIGLDTAKPAVVYAREAGILDGFVARNLEQEALSAAERPLIADIDLVISTGAIGYVGAATFAHILECTLRRPWFALFALRMFPVDAIVEVLKAHDYAVWTLAGQTFRQRRFADGKEEAEVLANLERLGIDPARREESGWYHAEFFFARPKSDGGPLPIAGLAGV